MATSTAKLRLIDPETGEITEAACPSCAGKEHELAELQRKMRGLARELGELREVKRLEAEADKLWPVGVRVFAYHNRLLNHPGAEWNVKRFTMVARELRKKNGLERCLRGIAGKAADRWAREHGHTTFDDVFETAKKFEKCLAKAPADWTMPAGAMELSV